MFHIQNGQQFSDQLTEVPYQDNYKVALGGEITPHVAVPVI